MKFIVFVFDGLRPDHVTPESMPHLAAFAAAGVRMANARTVFPSETRVAVSTLVTGTWPMHHGIVGNEFIERRTDGAATIRTGNRGDLEALAAANGGAVLARPTLSRRLTAYGLRHAVVSTASPGSSFLLDPEANPLGQFSWSVHGEGNAPTGLATEIERHFGPVPPAAIPNTARIDHAASILIDFVLPRVAPDVAVFWSNDPDMTYHYRGLGGAATLAALRGADAAFGRLIDWWRSDPQNEDVQIVVASDHGHVTGAAKIDVIAALRGAGIRAAAAFAGGAEVAVLPGAVNALYAREPDAIDRAEAWLRDQPWCGLLLRRNSASAGAFDLAAVGLHHPRAPDLAFTFAGRQEADGHGLPGFYPFDGELPVGAGMHGGLHRRELANVLICGGSAFRTGFASDTPAGLIDVAPTLAHLLGIDGGTFDGRVLHEALAGDGGAPASSTETKIAQAGDRQRRLVRWQVGSSFYLGGDDTAY